MTRAPFQVLVYPYFQVSEQAFVYALLRRADEGWWQGVAGGGEDGETPLDAARRETYEETVIPQDAPFLRLDTVFPVPVTTFGYSHIWGDDVYIIPQYCFGVQARDKRRHNAVNVSLFDCNAGVGKTGLGYPAAEQPAEFLAVMDHYGIDEALVYDLTDLETGRFDDPSTIQAFCAQSDRLFPSMPVVPPETGEQPPAEAWVEQLLSAGIRAVRAYPMWHRFDFLPYCMGSLFEVLQAHRVPIFVTYYVPEAHPWEHTPDWDHVCRTALAFPELPIIVLYTGMLQHRRILPLMARCPNVRFDTISSTFRLLEFVSERFGPERLVIGTRYPKYEPGLHVSWPRYADLDDRARALIAGDNIRNMLEAVQ